MIYQPLWKYCTAAHESAFLLSLRLLGETDFTAEKQLACLYAVSNHVGRHYLAVQTRKRDGTLRHLLVPDPLLKRIQRNILHGVLEGFPISPYATAYHRGASILNNARPHVGRERLLKLDLEDFFGAITFQMVYSRAFPAEYFPPAVRALLTHLCCFREHLPQGAPTSAAISNLVLRPFDEHMGSWCEARGIRYTRYCDDMAFSGDFDARLVVAKARRFLGVMGFSLNEKKTAVLTAANRQIVTGVVVNQKPQVSRQTRRSLRQAIHYCQTFGTRQHLVRIQDTAYLPLGPEGETKYLQSLLGKVNHVLSINPSDTAFQEARGTLRRMLQGN